MPGPKDKDPKKGPILFLHQAKGLEARTQKQERELELEDDVGAKQEARLKSETSLLEQSVRSALLIMRGMYAQLKVLNIDTPEAKQQRTQLITEIQKLESRLESFTNAVGAVDQQAISRVIIEPEALQAKLDNIRQTVKALAELVITEHEQDVFDQSPDGKFKILSNMLTQAIDIASKNLRILDAKVEQKMRHKL